MEKPDINIEESLLKTAEYSLEETTDLTELALIELRNTNLPVIDVFNLVKLGNNNKQIADLLSINPKQVTTIKSLACYKQLKKEWAEEQQEISQAYVSKQIGTYQNLATKAAKRLEELMASENEKVALESSRFITNHLDKLHQSQVEQKVLELENTINVILGGDSPETVIDVRGEDV